MPRALVAVGCPSNLEDNEFEYGSGDKKGTKGFSLRFVLGHQMTAMSGSVQCEASDEQVIARIREAHANGEVVECACIPRGVAYKDKTTGKDEMFYKLHVRAVQAA